MQVGYPACDDQAVQVACKTLGSPSHSLRGSGSCIHLQPACRLPTPVQSEALPLILGGGDVMAAAETGSGKTGAFALPILQIVHESIVERQEGPTKAAS